VIALTLIGCGSIATHDTARIVTAHSELSAALVVSQNTSPLLGVVPFPSLDVVHRRPLGPDSDLGIKLLGGAPGIDVRRRLVRRERLDVTLGSAASGGWVPTGSDVRGIGYLHLTTPVLTTVSLSSNQSLTLAVSPGVRWRTVTASRDGFITDGINVAVPLLAAGGRWELGGHRRAMAVSFDLLASPGKGGPTGWAASLQSTAARLRSRDQIRRAVRRSAREARR